jgi:ribosomal protein S18 acetylase RimI-like enzyme
MTVSVRVATAVDLPAVLALYRQPGLDDEVLPEAEAKDLFRRFASYPDYRLFVAEDDGAVVGSFALLIMDNIAHLGARAGVIEAVVVDPARQGEGIGRIMMEHALAECRARGCYKTSLSANLKREPAHAFYESLGFERHGYSFRVMHADSR